MSPFVIVGCALITFSVVDCKDGFTPYIVNGTDAQINEFPFQVSLRYKAYRLYGGHICGASILNSMWILTAAHCVTFNKARKPKRFSVQYGVTTIHRTGPNIVNVSKIVVHPRFDKPTFIHDIALIRLKKPIKFGETARPVGLPRMSQSTAAGTRAVLAGWGKNATEGRLQNHLQKVDLTIVSKKRCRDIYGGRTHATEICAGSEDRKGGCMGDSGGALIANDVAVGIASRGGMPCAWYPSIYTEVSNYIGWIRRTIKK